MQGHKKVIVSVAKTDIEKGLGGDCNHCAIARALTRKFKHQFSVGAAGCSPSLFSMDSLNLPREVITFIRRFDASKRELPEDGYNLKPFRFTLTISDGWLNEFNKKVVAWRRAKQLSNQNRKGILSAIYNNIS